MSRTKTEILIEAQSHFKVLEEYAKRSLDDRLVLDAICMRLSAGIEALARLSPSDRDHIFGTTWPLMWGMRNRIAHGYLQVDAAIIRETTTQDIPQILHLIEREIHEAPE